MACYHRKILCFLRGSCEIESLYHTTQESIQEDKKHNSWFQRFRRTIAKLWRQLRTLIASLYVPNPKPSMCLRVPVCILLVQNRRFCCIHPCCPKPCSATQCCRRRGSLLPIRKNRDRRWQSCRSYFCTVRMSKCRFAFRSTHRFPDTLFFRTSRETCLVKCRCCENTLPTHCTCPCVGCSMLLPSKRRSPFFRTRNCVSKELLHRCCRTRHDGCNFLRLRGSKSPCR